MDSDFEESEFVDEVVEGLFAFMLDRCSDLTREELGVPIPEEDYPIIMDKHFYRVVAEMTYEAA